MCGVSELRAWVESNTVSFPLHFIYYSKTPVNYRALSVHSARSSQLC